MSRGTARAVVLAAVMVLSVVAMSAVFAGSAAAEPDESSANVTLDEGDSVSISGDILEEKGAIEDQTNVTESEEIFDSFNGDVDQGLVVNVSSTSDGDIPGRITEDFNPQIRYDFDEPVNASNGDGSDIVTAVIYYDDANGESGVGYDYGSFQSDAQFKAIFITDEGSVTNSVGDTVETTTGNLGKIIDISVENFVEEYETAEVESLSVELVNQDSEDETVEYVAVGDQTIPLDQVGDNETSVQIGNDYYTSIQSAVDDAESGDTIEVESGDYDQIVINRSEHSSDLTIKAASEANPTVSHSEENGEPAIAIDQDNITVEGLTVKRSTSSNNVAQAVRVAGDNVSLNNNTYQLGESATDDAAVAVLTDSSGAAENPTFTGTISDVSISGGEIITKDASQFGVLVADNGDASFGADGSVSVSGVEFTAKADSTHVLELGTEGGVIDTEATLNNNTFSKAARPVSTSGESNGYSIDGKISSTVQGAVNHAAQDSTVEVISGTYEESVTVDVSGLTLKGPNAGVDGNSSDRGDEAAIKGTVEPTVDDVTLDGVKIIQSDGSEGVFLNTAGGTVKISNSVIDLKSSAAFGIEYTSPVDSLQITNNLIQNGLNGVLVSSTGDATITNNTITGMEDTSNYPAGAAVKVAAGQAGNNEITITNNNLTDNAGAFLIDGGDVGSDASITLKENNIVGNTEYGVSITEKQSISVDAISNWWGDEDGPRAANVTIEGDVQHDPFLTEPVDDAADTDFGHDLVAPADTVTAVGFPGPTDQTVGEAFGEFEGVVYEWTDDGWQSIDNADRGIETLEAFAVKPTNGDVLVTVEFTASDVAAAPDGTTLEQGFNFVAPASAGTPSDADVLGFEDNEETLYDLYNTPDSTITTEDFDGISTAPSDSVSPFTGYFVHVPDGDRSHNAIVETGTTVDEIEQDLTNN